MRSGTFIGNFEKLIEQTIEIDDKLYERAMEKRHDGNGFGNHRYGYKKSNFNGNKSTSRPPPDPYGPMPMEFDFMRKKKQQPKRGRKQHKGFKKALKCYGCGKPGHIAKNCRSKNMVYRFQLNVMQKVSTEGLNSGDNSPVFDEDDFNQFLTESGSIEDKIKSRLKQESDNENDVEFQDTIETIGKLIQHTDRMLNRFYETQIGNSAKIQKNIFEQGQERQKSPKPTKNDWNNNDEWDAMTQKHSDNSDTWTHVFKVPQENMYEFTEMYRNYKYDVAYPKHGLIYWTTCAEQYCQSHKINFNNGYAYPQRTTCGNI